MVTLALRCLFVIGLGAVVAMDWAKVIAVLPSTIVVSGVVVVLELSGTSVDVLGSFFSKEKMSDETHLLYFWNLIQHFC